MSALRSRRLSARLAACTLLAGGALASCGTRRPPLVVEGEGPSAVPTVERQAGPVRTQVSLVEVGLSADALDRAVDPCSDFYRFACGAWLDKTEIPAEESAWYRSFSEIERRNDATLRAVLDEAAKLPNDAADPTTARLGGFYASCIDEAAIDASKTTAIDPLLAKASAVKSATDVGSLLAELHEARVFAVFDITAALDDKDATRRILRLDQSGLGLPDRDMYLEAGADQAKLRASYQRVVERVLARAGLKDAPAAAARVVALETELARAQKSAEDRRKPEGMYNKIDRSGLEKVAPRLGWGAYAKRRALEGQTNLTVTHVPYFEAVNRLLPGGKEKAGTAEAWRAYLAWSIVRSTAHALPRALADEVFELQKLLAGVEAQPPRWKRCLDATDAALGEVLGQAYVKRAFAGESKAVADQMVARVRQAFAKGLTELPWMDALTRARALAKMEKMEWLVGHPKRPRDYDFEVSRTSFARNVLAARRFESKRDLARLGRSVDRTEWQMSASAVNAYYDPQQNHMVFPAGILQPPFYSVKSHTPVNLGGIGMVIGHELTHGFDDEGSHYDGSGNLVTWWEPPVLAAFREKTACVEQQYGAFEPLPGLKLKGKLTLGENIADLGGVKLAFGAYRAMRDGAAEVLEAEGFSEDQQFFLAHGQAWCAKYREPAMRRLVETNPHSPPRFRVNGPLMSSPDFAQAFSCKPGSTMLPAQACSVW